MTEAVQGDVVPTRPVLDVTGATAALAVGPNEVLVVTFASEYADDATYPGAMAELRERFLDVLPPGRFLIIFADGVDMSKVDSPPDPAHPYPLPVLTAGPTCPRCGSPDAVTVDGNVTRCHRCQVQLIGEDMWAPYADEPDDETLPEPVEEPRPAETVPKGREGNGTEKT